MTPLQDAAYKQIVKRLEEGLLSVDDIIKELATKRHPEVHNGGCIMCSLTDEAELPPVLKMVLNVKAEKYGNSLWVDVCPSHFIPGDPEYDVARVRLEVWGGALWLRAWRGQETETDPYLNEKLYPTRGTDGKKENC